MNPPKLLLDTCAIIFFAEGNISDFHVVEKIDAAAQEGALFVSPVSALEIGRLSASGKLPLASDPQKFFSDFVKGLGTKICPMEPEQLIESSFLPGKIHKDPVDRILVATARHHGFELVTSDRAILKYGRDGYVKTLAC